MIKILATVLRSPQVLLPLVLFGIGGLIISSAWNLYGEQAHQQLPNAKVQPKTNEAPTVQEIRSKITGSSSKEYDQLDIIAEKNLFTSNRQAWQPPKKKDSDQGGDQEVNDSKKQAAKIRQISRSKIRLYGTTMTGSNNMALMYMEPFESKRKYYTVHEGEVMRDEGERGDWLYFKVLSVDAKSVTLEDPEGESFEVGLFDHQREQKKTASRDTSGIHIVVGGEEEESEPRDTKQKEQEAEGQNGGQEAREDESQTRTGQDQEGSGNATTENANATDTGERSEGEDDGQAQQGKQSGPQSLIDALQNLQNRGNNNNQDSTDQPQPDQGSEERENMRKIETPFGTIYRPAD